MFWIFPKGHGQFHHTGGRRAHHAPAAGPGAPHCNSSVGAEVCVLQDPLTPRSGHPRKGREALCHIPGGKATLGHNQWELWLTRSLQLGAPFLKGNAGKHPATPAPPLVQLPPSERKGDGLRPGLLQPRARWELPVLTSWSRCH